MSMKRKNSARVLASARNVPTILLVTIDTPRLCTPRVVMHWWTASITTPTPRGLSTSLMQRCDLRSEFFLNLETAREAVHHARELADPDDACGRQITHVRAPDDRRHVVLAKGFEGDVAKHDHLVVALDFLESPAEVIARIDGISGEPIAVGVDHALRRVPQTLRAADHRQPIAAASGSPLPPLRASPCPCRHRPFPAPRW